MTNIKLTSYGATEEVTGSCHLLNIDGYRILIDCGLFQGSYDNYIKNWNKLEFDPKDLDAVILTHAHLDHCGRLPLLFAQGYKGQVYTTRATSKLASVVVEDNLHIMNQKVAKRKLTKLYGLGDFKKLERAWHTLDYYKEKVLTPNIKFKLHNAGHILGAAIVEIKAGDRTIVFSGDLGTEGMPLVKDIDYLEQADYIIMESTYGDRLHEDTGARNQKLLQAVQQTTINHSTLLISVFAIERSQDILKVLNDYYETHLDFRVPVFLDSPMAARATIIYDQEKELLNQKAQDDLAHDRNIFNFPHLKITNNQAKSKAINNIAPPKIILAGSGMAEGGRILHHLARYASDAKNHIMFMGFQVSGTLGHKLCNGAYDFDYYGKTIEIKAKIEQLDSFSAHGDQKALLKWLGHFKKPKKVFLSHGDKEIMEKFTNVINKELGFSVATLKNNEPTILN